ncbi:uncharacterized protein NPIL_107151 [Nephila pilipes]|uniref:Uncharacterized protein n=1 Tax=Nephila pilipes TaxID=299642 RepID=A0A8X6IHW7_NEPPI|nr:uncharacterized protein NPIL_107151 [Nephila pilipes]
MEREMEFELQKLRIEQLRKAYLDSSVGKKPDKRSTPCHELAKMFQRFDSKNDGISLYLSLFERRAKKIDINSKDWISRLLMLLPPDLVQSIPQKSGENFDNYTYN